MKFIIYSFFLLLAAPCNKEKQIASSDKSNSSVIISYQTTACFGRCPIYTLTINGETKTATFNGEQHTEKTGMYSKAISSKELQAFVDAFDKAGFNSLNDEYLGMITDFPIKIITYTKDGKTKKIKERSGAPEALINLEKMLNEYASSEDGWKKTEDSSNSKD
jgi:uncharacterized protein DUF6438